MKKKSTKRRRNPVVKKVVTTRVEHVPAKRKARKRPAVKRKSPARAQPRASVKEKETMKRKRKKTGGAKKKHHATKKTARRRRRRNPGTGQPVLVANPAPRRKRRRHHGKRRAIVGSKRRRTSRRRKSNPGLGGAFVSVLVGLVGAGASALAGYGVSKTNLSPKQKAFAKGAIGVAGAIPMSLASPALGVGFGAGMGTQAIVDGVQAYSAPSGGGDAPQLNAVSIRERLLAAENAGIDSVYDLDAVEVQMGAVYDELGAVYDD